MTRDPEAKGFAQVLTEELDEISLRSRIFVNKTALERSRQTFRDLQRQADEPAIYADSIFSGVDVLKEMERCARHIRHLSKEIHECEKAIFKHKIRYGENEEF